MSEIGSPEITVIGVPESTHERVRGEYRSDALERRHKELAKLRPARLTAEQLSQARDVEQASKEFLAAKMQRLGLPAESMMDLPEIYYTRPQYKQDRDTGGNFNPLINVTQVFATSEDFIHSLGHIPHEESHAAVSREVEYFFPDDKDLSNFIITEAGGLTFIEDHEEKARGIEEGMVLWDQVEFFHTVMSKMYPKEYAKRRHFLYPTQRRVISQSPHAVLRDYRRNIDSSLYGPLDEAHVAPFLSFPSLAASIPVLRSITSPVIQTTGMIKEYLFVRKLSEIVGRNISGVFDPHMDEEAAVKAGRDILDRDRYLRTGDARQQIRNVLGEGNAQKVFTVEDHDTSANIDNGMRTLLSVQAQHSTS